MFSLRASLRTLDRAMVQWHQLAHTLNVVSCGLMIGAALFHPISAAESHRYCEIVLPTFAISSFVWFVLNLRAFMSVGQFTVPLGLVKLLLVVMQGKPAIDEFTAWLPLYVGTVGMITTSLNHILSQVLWATDLAVNNDEDDASMLGSTARQHHNNQQIPAITRWLSEPLQPLARYVLGQEFNTILPTKGSATTLSLSSTGQIRPSWGSTVHGFWNCPSTTSYRRDLDDRPDDDIPNGWCNHDYESIRGKSFMETKL